MRLARHLRYWQGESWGRFSVYLTICDSHLRELELLTVRIVKPQHEFCSDWNGEIDGRYLFRQPKIE
jgi:hypothetical protein